MFIDIHTHLPQYDDNDLDEIVSRWRLGDVKYVISVGTTIDDSRKSISLSKRYNDVLAGIGMHPSDLTQNWKQELIQIKKLSDCNLSMISEIGLDYQDISPNKQIQIEAFEFQINLALEKKLPIVFHTRNAMDDTYSILKNFSFTYNPGAIHYFDGTYEDAKKMIDLGYKISFAKTLIRQDHLKVVAKKISIEDIVIETDSYPQYFKKNRQRWTEPKDVKLVAQEISRIKNIEIDEVGKITSCNALNFIKV
tara:strand:- start:1096 stop:1848 length:753 start_codon:yes stop_codon:yes gene_type:complete